MTLDADDRRFIEKATTQGHEDLVRRSVQRAVDDIHKELKPFLELVAEHELTLNGTEKNPGGLVAEHQDIKSKINKIWILLPLLPPSAIAAWEVGKFIITSLFK